MLYFDHNATSPMHPAARQAWVKAAEEYIGNPSSPHRIGSRADAALTGARERLAGLLGCHPIDIVWTSGATESNNAVFHHLARALAPEAEVWVSAIEHPSVLAAAQRYFPARLRRIPVTRSGVIDLAWLEDNLAERPPGLCAVMAANNETGVLQPWRGALELCQARGTPFFSDATQWIGRLPVRGLGACDFLSGSAHKCGGPKGVGFLKCPSGARIHPLLVGGPQEEERRAGTENVAGVLAMVAALTIREEAIGAAAAAPGGRMDVGVVEDSAALQGRLALREAMEAEMVRMLPGLAILGAGKPRLWNTVSAVMPQADCRLRWVVKLDKLGFAVSTGSACASGREEPSHVIAAMGYSADEAARVLRFSSGWETTREEWSALVSGLNRVWKEFARPG